MKQRIVIFGILVIALILFSPTVFVVAEDITMTPQVQVPPTNPPWVEPVPDGIMSKITQYVVDYSGISEDYFNAHYEILNVYKTTYDCMRGGCKQPGFPTTSSCFNTYTLECNYTYAVHVFWSFKIDNYTTIVGDHYSAGIASLEAPQRFVFIIENGEVKEHWRYNYINQVLQNRPFPKFREITNVISQTQLNNIKDGCGTFTKPNAIKLTTICIPETETITGPYCGDGVVHGDNLSLIFYSYGKKDGKDFELFADLETRENYCNEIMLVGGQKTGVITSTQSTNYTNLILIIVGIIVFLLIIIGIYKKFKK